MLKVRRYYTPDHLHCYSAAAETAPAASLLQLHRSGEYGYTHYTFIRAIV